MLCLSQGGKVENGAEVVSLCGWWLWPQLAFAEWDKFKSSIFVKFKSDNVTEITCQLTNSKFSVHGLGREVSVINIVSTQHKNNNKILTLGGRESYFMKAIKASQFTSTLFKTKLSIFLFEEVIYVALMSCLCLDYFTLVLKKCYFQDQRIH